MLAHVRHTGREPQAGTDVVSVRGAVMAVTFCATSRKHRGTVFLHGELLSKVDGAVKRLADGVLVQVFAVW